MQLSSTFVLHDCSIIDAFINSPWMHKEKNLSRTYLLCNFPFSLIALNVLLSIFSQSVYSLAKAVPLHATVALGGEKV
jgi:hypothetical protein